jgi:NSS family neurotransmitter:Na+ symporter
VACSSWSSTGAFIASAAAAAIGLGNVWRFPYLVNRYGGGAFVLAYLIALALIGLPLLAAEVMIGRGGRANPSGCFGSIARREGRSCRWSLAGGIGSVAGVLILSLYSLVGGSAMEALGRIGLHVPLAPTAPTPNHPGSTGLLSWSWTLFGCHAGFVLLVVLVAARGLRRGLEPVQVRILPAVLLLLGGLLLYSQVGLHQLDAALAQLLAPDFSELGWWGILEAARLAVLTLGLGLGMMMSFGAGLPAHGSIVRSTLAIVALDTGVALLTALVIFSLLHAGGVSITQGPALAFTAIPSATDSLSGNVPVSASFYGFLLLTTLGGALGIVHPVIEQLSGWFRLSRAAAGLAAGGLVLLLLAIGFLADGGAGPSGHWALLETLGSVGSNLLLPAAVLAVALFSGWAMSRRANRHELALGNAKLFLVWRWLIRYAAPVALSAIMVMGLIELAR